MTHFVPHKREKDSITVRLPADLLEEVDKLAGHFDISRNELITQCIEFALSNMDRQPKT